MVAIVSAYLARFIGSSTWRSAGNERNLFMHHLHNVQTVLDPSDKKDIDVVYQLAVAQDSAFKDKLVMLSIHCFYLHMINDAML